VKVIGETTESCMISGQENVLVNQGSKLCEIAGSPLPRGVQLVLHGA
jgi:hypothetical protein